MTNVNETKMGKGEKSVYWLTGIFLSSALLLPIGLACAKNAGAEIAHTSKAYPQCTQMDTVKAPCVFKAPANNR